MIESNLARVRTGTQLLVASVAFTCLINPAFAATTVLLGAVTQITGPQDLDLDGEFVYAINFSANDPSRTVHGVRFLPDRLPIPGATLVGPQQVAPWQTKPEFGTSADANALEEILQDIRWANTAGGERLRATLKVVPGEEYKLQILISANGTEDRRWDVRVNGQGAVDEITSLGASPGQSYSQGRATLYTHQFVSAGTSVIVEMGNLFGANDGGDRNPIWQGLTLERVSTPPTPDDLVVEPTKFFPMQTLPIATLQAVDRKFAATHTFSFVNGAGDADNARFSLEGAQLLPAPFDFSSQPTGTTYSIRLRATDAADAARFIEKAFTLELVEAHPPTAISLDAEAVSGAAVPGGLVARIHAEDADVFDRHLFELVAGPGSNQNAFFTLEGDALKLALPLPVGVTEFRLRLRATDRAGLAIESAFVLPLVEPRVRINEVLASDLGGIIDENRQPQEWIELQNQLTQSVDLTGWYLTDDRADLRKWKFPAKVIGPDGYVVVLADGTGAVVPGSTNLHANFSLNAGGEWLALVRPDGVTIASELLLPAQYPSVAYGFGSQGDLGFLPQPTPGAANGVTAVAGANLVTFSQPHGFHTASFPLELSAAVPDSTIRYTLDGSRPTATAGLVYSGPITVTPNTSGTTRGLRIVRALAVNSKAAYAPVGTQTYFFVNGVAGPSVDGIVGQTRLLTSITKHATYGPLLDDAFLALPAVSVVTSSALGTTEARASVELIDPHDLEPGFQADCGLEATGTTSLGSPKLSMAAKFRAKYGLSRLRYPVFARGSMAPGPAATEFNELRLRSHSHDTFYWLGLRENPPVPYGSPPVNRSGDAQLTRNPWIDEMQLLMGQPGKHGRQVHLFLNGSYNGIYHLHEHADDSFMASYYPGSSEDFHYTAAAVSGSDRGGGDSWSAAWSSLKASLGNYQQARRWVDITNLCDYMVLSFYAGNDWDWWGQHNWSAAGPRYPDAGGWKFFQQDSDVALQDVAADCTDQDAPDGVFARLISYADFRVLFRDRVYLHCFGDGALTPTRAGALYEARMNEISTAIIAETARWQPSSSVGKLPWDRDEEWTNEWRYFRTVFFPQRTKRLIDQFRKHAGWWPADPPALNLAAGTVPPGSELIFTNRTGQTYFTTDGSDPRLPGGAKNPAARPAASGASALTIDRPLLVKARVYTGSDWSALVVVYLVPEGTSVASAENLVLSEIHYHPLDEPDTEFLEFLNTSGATVDLSDAVLTNGVSFTFPQASLLPPGGRAVVVKDLAAFDPRYRTAGSPYFQDGLTVFGSWTGSLGNSGDTLDLLAADGSLIFSCKYGTDGAWPSRADGRGSSLELEDPAAAPLTVAEKSAWLGDPHRWRPSSEFHGSPGAAGRGPDNSVVINEVLAAPLLGDSDGIEFVNASGRTVELGGWFVSDSSGNYRKYRFPDGTRLDPGARLAIRAADFDNPANPGCLEAFGLADTGDDVFLVEANHEGALLRFVDRVEFDHTPPGTPVGHYPDATGPLVWLQVATLGAPNSAPVPGYAAWSATTFSRDTPAEQTAPDADFDDDGVSNFAAYAFATSPKHTNPPPLEIVDDALGGGVTIVYRTRTAATGLSYQLELSPDLHSWSPAGNEVEIISTVPQQDGATLVTARLLPADGLMNDARFARIRVEGQ